MSIDWQPMATAPQDGGAVLVCFRCPLSGALEMQPAHYDDGLDQEGEPFQQAGWWYFDQSDTGPIDCPLTWAPYPQPDKATWLRLGNPQVAA